MIRYRHTQIGWAILLPVLGVLGGLGATVPTASGTPAVLPWVAATLIAFGLLFATLTVTVADGSLTCRFGIGIIRRTIRLKDVRTAEAVRNRWYYGWGIRLVPQGWLWNVSGLDVVELTFTDGKRFRIGTDEPERLLAAIRG